MRIYACGNDAAHISYAHIYVRNKISCVFVRTDIVLSISSQPTYNSLSLGYFVVARHCCYADFCYLSWELIDKNC